MKFETPKSNNYAAVIVRVGEPRDLAGLDNLVAIQVLGHQALTTRGIMAGELRIAFTSETQLSEEYCRHNNLYRDATLNEDPSQTGYLEANRRIRAIKLRGHKSNALLMPLSSLAVAHPQSPVGAINYGLKEGDTFDTINGVEICRKYEVPVKPGSQPSRTKVEKAFKRVTDKQFPMHLETDNYWRNKHLLDEGREVIITQKLHGTSIRVGRVPCLREKGRVEKFINRWFPTADHDYDVVVGSRKVIKDVNNPRQQHFYKEDIWSSYGKKKIADLIPEGYIVYGELIGWTPDGTPLQKGYTYHVPQGSAELFVYRVATVNAQGHLSDLSWDGVKAFCTARGLKWTPELFRWTGDGVDSLVERWMDKRFADHWPSDIRMNRSEQPLPLSHKLSVDEGLVIRQDALVPVLLKAKSPIFLEHETKMLDKGEADLESQEAADAA